MAFFDLHICSLVLITVLLNFAHLLVKARRKVKIERISSGSEKDFSRGEIFSSEYEKVSSQGEKFHLFWNL